ncbi:LpxL/LpxP family Kdo(2)-lipid IV(A) lauroyl/palmitoleoyl acyltransferase [Thioalkalivibrio sulfidiphilus]|uniref:LpxL/LpxP family Kdo(2)-lipid IV(A) lauroyl/palmitoleoyl acyltransferase n=1 Tax=Thioalkalivibrio sulfidiphilus TaxID=1033854 RepID=UPI003B336055
MARKSRSHSPFRPRYWGYWLLVAILWTLSRLPLGIQRLLGTGIGDLFHATGRRRRHIARVNVDLCFPQLGDAERGRMVRAHFRSVGFALFETALSWWGSDARLGKLVRIEGLEYLEQALDQGKGVLLLSAHFTTLELAGRLLALHHPFAVMYRPHENPVIERLFANNRNRHFERAIRRNDVKGLLKALKDNQVVWYAPDQGKGGKNSVIAPFFGEPAATQTGTHRIARVSGAPVVPFFGFRTPDGHYRLVIKPALDDFPGEDPLTDTTRVNQVIEAAVREAPEQYFWAHRRFKKREGLPDPYRSA